jgi:hypothetical protein
MLQRNTTRAMLLSIPDHTTQYAAPMVRLLSFDQEHLFAYCKKIANATVEPRRTNARLR